MKKRINLFILSICMFYLSFAQETNLDLLKKQYKTHQIGFLFFNNKINEQILEIKSIQNYKYNDTPKVIFEKIIYAKGLKKGRIIAYLQKNDSLKKEFKYNIITFPSRAYHFIKSLPNKLSSTPRQNIELNPPLIIKDSQNRILFVKIENWEETYKYDENGNLSEIYNDFNPINSDSTLTSFCLITPKLWTGKYHNNNLIEEETAWGDGKKVKGVHTWKNDTLIESSCTSYLIEDIHKIKYIYKENKISQVLEYTKDGKLFSKKEYKWK